MTQSDAAEPTDRNAFQSVSPEHVVACEQLCMGLAIPAGAQVLDIVTGSGHTAIAAARRRAVVTAMDADAGALEGARCRALAEGFDQILFRSGHPLDIPGSDASFDYVLSVFGSVFVPDQAGVAREAARLLKPGGRLGLIAHVPHGLPSRIFDLVFGLFPGMQRPAHAHYEWSMGTRAAELLGGYFGDVAISYASYDSCYTSVEAAYEHVVANHGQIGPLLKRSAPETVAAFRDGYLRILRDGNRATDGTFLANIQYGVIKAVK